MQALYDFLPLLAFFVAYRFAGGIYVATAVLLVATVLVVGVQWLRHRRVSRMALISAALALLFGGATLLIHDQLFIMWKPTVLYVLFAAGFLASQLFTSKPVVQRMLEQQIATDAASWRTLNLAWVAFFVLLACANYAFVHGFMQSVPGSPEQKRWESSWVTWKFASIGVVVLFAFGQGLWLARRASEPDPQPGNPPA